MFLQYESDRAAQARIGQLGSAVVIQESKRSILYCEEPKCLQEESFIHIVAEPN
jgi:hypothetical protein